MIDHLKSFLDLIQQSISQHIFVKLSLSKYQGSEESLKNIYIKKVILKNGDKLSFTYRYQTKDVVKNYSFDEAYFFITKYIEADQFHIANLFTLDMDYRTEYTKTQAWIMMQSKPTFSALPSSAHDNPKIKVIPSKDNPYLHALKITDAQGKVYAHAQDKYKQINHYIEVLSTLLKSLTHIDLIKIVDMGAGKGYLTFALYDYLHHVLHRPVEITGVEVRKDLVDLCNRVAKESHFAQLRFEEGTIDSYPSSDFNILIALHACDTATDDAIFKGITSHADIIVVAPCCHKQIRREIEKYKIISPLDDLIRHGIFLERQSEMITDAIRGLILEYYGYTIKVFDFIADAHTPKNIMITAQKTSDKKIDRQKIIDKISNLKSMFGIHSHYLEKKLNLL